MNPKYKIGDTVYWLEDCTDWGGEGPFFMPVKCQVTDVFTGEDEEFYYQLKNDDEVIPFTGMEFDEIHESKLFTTWDEADKAWQEV